MSRKAESLVHFSFIYLLIFLRFALLFYYLLIYVPRTEHGIIRYSITGPYPPRAACLRTHHQPLFFLQRASLRAYGRLPPSPAVSRARLC